MTSVQLHGTCIAIDGIGVLLRGRSGAGKSDLGLRLIDAGAEVHYLTATDDLIGVLDPDLSDAEATQRLLAHTAAPRRAIAATAPETRNAFITIFLPCLV